MALLTGLTDQGLEVPVQVTPAGVLVAEGLPGKDGADGNNGAAEVGSGYVILQGAGAAQVMGCWGQVVSKATEFARVTFPRPFIGTPAVAVTDATKTQFSATSGFLWHAVVLPGFSGVDVQCIQIAGGGVDNTIRGDRVGLWLAWGPVA